MTLYELHLQQALWYMLMGLVARTLAAGHWTDYTHRVPVLLQYVLMVFAHVMFAWGFVILGFLIVGPQWTAAMIFVAAGIWLRQKLRDDDDDDDDFDGD